MTAKIRDVELKRAMIGQGSSLNIISVHALDAMRVLGENITRQLIEISGFGSSYTYNLGL